MKTNKPHAHNFQWDNKTAYYRCTKCKKREALCVQCGKRLGIEYVEGSPKFCKPEHEIKWMGLGVSHVLDDIL